MGKERRTDPSSTHSGLQVNEFIDEAVKALKEDIYESAAGMAENMRRNREALFPARIVRPLRILLFTVKLKINSVNNG